MASATWVSQDHPDRSYGAGNDAGTASIRVRSGERIGVLRTRPAVPAGATVVSATLRLYVAVDFTVGASTTVMLRGFEAKPPAVLTWNTIPAGSGPTVSAVVTGGVHGAGSWIEFDVQVFAQAVADGVGAWYGLRVTSDNATDPAIRFAGFASDDPDWVPEWTIVTATPPEVPDDLTPNGGVAASATPVLSWTFADADGDALAAAHIQARVNNADLATPDFDTGEVALLEPRYETAPDVAWPTVTASDIVYWRVRHKDATGIWSDWSDVASWIFEAHPVVSVTSPGTTTTDPTPTVTASSTDTVTAYRVRVYDDEGRWLYDSGKVKAATVAHTLPRSVKRRQASQSRSGRDWLQEDRTYTVSVDVWDDFDRVAAEGLPTYVTADTMFTLDQTTANNILQVSADAPVEGAPWVDVTVQLSATPDGLVLFRTGTGRITHLDEDDLADAEIAANTYRWRDWWATGWRDVTYSARATASGAQGVKVADGYPVRPECVGVILFHPDSDTWVRLAGTDVDSWASTLQRVSVQPLGAPTPTSMVYGATGLAGSFGGVLDDPVRSVDDQLAALARLSRLAKAGRPLRLAVQDFNIAVSVTSTLDPTPHGDSTPDRLLYRVQLSFEELV